MYLEYLVSVIGLLLKRNKYTEIIRLVSNLQQPVNLSERINTLHCTINRFNSCYAIVKLLDNDFVSRNGSLIIKILMLKTFLYRVTYITV